MPNNVLPVQECDATMLNSSNIAGYIKTAPLILHFVTCKQWAEYCTNR